MNSQGPPRNENPPHPSDQERLFTPLSPVMSGFAPQYFNDNARCRGRDEND